MVAPSELNKIMQVIANQLNQIQNELQQSRYGTLWPYTLRGYS